MSNNGMGTLWVQCPLTAANRVAATGRMTLCDGWSNVRIDILEPRQLQCFRCLQKGHVRNACPNAESRSDICYRCSQAGHLARACTGKPHCVLCKELGLDATHRIGGAACKAPKRSAGPPGDRNKRPTGDKMEVEAESRPAVRGGSPRSASGGAPVPVRSDTRENEEEAMEVETDPAPSLPPLEKRSPRESKGREEPATTAPSPE